MHKWLILAALLSNNTAHAETPGDIETVTEATQEECDIVLAIISSRPNAETSNVWPVLGVYEADPRTPLDCSSAFAKAHLAVYTPPPQTEEAASSGYSSLSFTRPIFKSDGQATIEEENFVAPFFRSRMRYILEMKVDKWVIVSDETLFIT
jgi:hypothetical protein